VVRPPYPVAVRLCVIASERFGEIDSAYHALPVPLLRLPPHRYLNMVYSWVIERVPHDKLEDFMRDLEDLLPWQDTSSEAAIDIESESFMAMAAKGGG